MLQTTKGAINGLIVKDFIKGEVYDLKDEDLLKVFLDNKFAEKVEGNIAKRETKVLREDEKLKKGRKK